jgi:predicted AAA+ superfamily ATPase
MQDIQWDARLIGIKGARGIGKTTLLLQYIQLNLSQEINKVLYVSLDAIWFNAHSLTELADKFVKRGGKYLFLDEVHKYPSWAQELKNIYDDYPELKVVFTGSSHLEILNARADLSRRAVVYTMQGLSFREFVSVETAKSLPIYSLDQILTNHLTISQELVKEFRPFEHFENYLTYGYYPFYQEQKELFDMRLSEVVNMILEIELPALRGVEFAYIHKLKQLLMIIAESVPFVPNVTKISDKIQINRTTLLSYLQYLDEIGLTRNLYKEANGISKLQKPNKIYLENTNLIYNLAKENANIGNTRETFFANQLAYKNTLEYTENGDFMVNKKQIFEIGGRTKGKEQIAHLNNSFIVADNIEFGFQNKIPLWLFGFCY